MSIHEAIERAKVQASLGDALVEAIKGLGFQPDPATEQALATLKALAETPPETLEGIRQQHLNRLN